MQCQVNGDIHLMATILGTACQHWVRGLFFVFFQGVENVPQEF